MVAISKFRIALDTSVVAVSTAPFTRLRDATRPLHVQLEADLDAVGELGAEPGRSRMVARYRDFYGGAEAIVGPWLAEFPWLRERSQALAASFDFHSGDATVERQASHPIKSSLQVHNREQALGFVYVIEGSALGGRVILRRLKAQGVDIASLDFLDPHDEAPGAAWQRVMGILIQEIAASETHLDEAVAGATAAFGFARSCLVRPVELP